MLIAQTGQQFLSFIINETKSIQTLSPITMHGAWVLRKLIVNQIKFAHRNWARRAQKFEIFCLTKMTLPE